MSEAFPDGTTEERFRAVCRDDDALRAGVLAVCARHGLSGAASRRFDDGSLPVYALDDAHVLKLYPPVFAEERSREAAVLEALHGRLPIPTPRLLATGSHSDWGYVLMQRLAGESLARVWPTLAPGERTRLGAELGAALATLHALRDDSVARLGPPDWSAFLAVQRERCVATQRARGLAPAWLEQLPDFLASAALTSPTEPALLHTEVMREHLLVTRSSERWVLSGLFDFEPAMRGAPEYEFASVGVFVSGGDARVLDALLAAYGYARPERDERLARRLLAYALLHRYSNLRWYLERLPPPAAPTLESLALRAFGCGDPDER